jgi:proton-dependent oligopeptide transporter, POT family
VGRPIIPAGLGQTVAAAPRRSTWFGQPKGLTILFLTQMWEQFSYYGMRALLVYYMTRELLLGQEKASLIYGAYTATAYFTPIFGGMLADSWLGKRRAIIIGATVMAAGHFMMSFDALLYVALATIALGNGLFLPSLPSQINDLYEASDPRRARAYNIYYVGINIGGFLAPLICGTLGELYGWHVGFAAAGVGMLAGLGIYVLGGAYLPDQDPWTRVDPLPRDALPRQAPTVYQASPSGRPAFTLPTQAAPTKTNPLSTIALLLGIGIAVTIFRGAYEQIGNTVALWSDANITRQVGSVTIPATWFQSLNPLLVFLMTPALLAYWRRRADRGLEPPATRRMALGALIVALSYALLAGVAAHAGQERANGLWLVLYFAIFTLGELHILPTGLGLFARLAPPRFAATTVAAWFLAIFTGSLSAGAVGTLWSSMSHAIFFAFLAVLATVAAIVLLALGRIPGRPDLQQTQQP